MATKSKLATSDIQAAKGNYNVGRNGKKIKKITIHHAVMAKAKASQIANVFTNPNRKASANYCVGYTRGDICCSLYEENRAWTSSSGDNDYQAITMEVANSSVQYPYPVSDDTLANIIDLCVDICERYNFRLNWTGDKNGTLTVHRMFANTACLPLDTELLTKDGWVKLKDIEIGDEVASPDLDNLNITFEPVYAKVPVKKQDTYTCNELTATKDHRIVFRSQYSDFWRTEKYADVIESNSMIPLAGTNSFDGIMISDDMIKLIIAIQADGSYMYEKNKDGDKAYYGIEFHFSKERKIKRIKEILKNLYIPFKETHQSNGTVKIRIYNFDGINVVDEFAEKYLTEKQFNWDLIKLNKEQAKLFLEEILLWDGSVIGNKYSSYSKQNLDVVNAIASLNNIGSRVIGNDVLFRGTSYQSLNSQEKRNKSQEVSCVSVKTGLILIRQNGKTFIVGNCPGEYLMSKMQYIADEVNKRLDGKVVPIITFTPGTYKLNEAKYIRTSPSLGANIVKVKNCSNAMKGALTSTNPNANAQIKAGITITALSFVTDSAGRVWAKNYNGYVCFKNKDGKINVSKA